MKLNVHELLNLQQLKRTPYVNLHQKLQLITSAVRKVAKNRMVYLYTLMEGAV